MNRTVRKRQGKTEEIGITYRVTDLATCLGGVSVEGRIIPPGKTFQFPSYWPVGHKREMAACLMDGGWVEEVKP